MRNDYVVYIHKNILNGKVYVGQTCNLSERWRNNGKNYFNSIKFYNAIKKYGWDNFTHEVVYSNLNKQAADKIVIVGFLIILFGYWFSNTMLI